MTPRIAITPGDLAGVGPDLCLRLAQQNSHAQWVAYADPDALKARAELLNISLTWHTFDPAQPVEPHQANHIIVHPIDSQAPTTLGEPNPEQAKYLASSLTQAVQACQTGLCNAILTGPVSKGIINDGGIPFTGHTEFIADLTNAHPVMMLASKVLRVALVTTHLPLSEISNAITPERISKVVRIIHQDLIKRFGCSNPSILVTGLNPHAGEDGHLGREEIDTIIPTLKTLQAEGINCQGPYPADTIFLPKYLKQADAVLAMYHDQGLPVLKYSGFHEAINITLGLPIIRTSVDHGTAFDLAGTNQVDMGSMQMAYDTAVTLATNSFKNESNNGT